MDKIKTIYKVPSNKRRDLIDGISSIAKSLLAMDANNEKIIKEQLAVYDENAMRTRLNTR